MDVQLLRTKLDRGLSFNVLLSSAKFLDSQSRDAPELTDPCNLPFYYYLGLQCQPKHVVQIGSRLGLPALCFLQGCKSVKEWVVLDQGEGPYARTITCNVQQKLLGQCNYWAGGVDLLRSKISDRRWDLALVTDRCEDLKIYLDDLWKHLANKGLLLVDYMSVHPINKAFLEFCKVKNREPLIFETRNRIGIVEK